MMLFCDAILFYLFIFFPTTFHNSLPMNSLAELLQSALHRHFHTWLNVRPKRCSLRNDEVELICEFRKSDFQTFLFLPNITYNVYPYNTGVTLSRSWANMAIQIANFEFRAKLVPNFVKPKQLRWLQKVKRWHPKMLNCIKKFTRRTNECTWWLNDVAVRVRCVLTRPRRCPVTSRWYKTFGRTLEVHA